MQTIIFLGSNKSGSSREAIIAAAEMGYFTVLLTDRRKWRRQREEFPDVHQMIMMKDLSDREEIFEQLLNIRVQGKRVKAFVSFIDPLVSLAADISKELGLQEVSVGALYKMEDKTRFRDELKRNPVSPQFCVCSLDIDADKIFDHHVNKLPVVLKSPISNGSKDVIKADSREEFLKGVQYFKKNFSHIPLLIEEYLSGPQYLIEVVVRHAKTEIVAIIEQEISSNRRFIITGYHMPARLAPDANETLTAAIEYIMKDIGLSHGTCHLEMRHVNDEWKLIEINPRISGSVINQMILESTGICLVRETLKLYLGEDLCLVPFKNEHVFAEFLTVDTPGKLIKVTGKNKAKKIEGVKKVYVKPRKGSILNPPLSMGDRYAYVLASSSDPAKAKEIAKRAAEEIKFYLEPL
ncbi:ATP-grasp domain-containing protein [Bacillus haikouensis]|uniref:ATP-grasp domain-containing protein n=1 Tax=Bacillus haikouensis TaxID=1510468 RepID=UPI001552D9AE|nr:ATP-grasp domain-containing protein [Bacillus haikouensis]NQD64981.1 ATP-grasp domain-containing protein [Bacillus haikouensis]